MERNPYPGKLIVLEGLDGSGQTTQAHLLVKWFQDKRSQLAYYTKEPTDGPIGALIRLALSRRLSAPAGGREFRPLDDTTMALFFAADRTDHLHNDIIPKIRDGIHVVADRYYLSSFAYQSIRQDVEWLRQINREATIPDLTVFLDVPPRVCVQRMNAQRWHVELYEDLATLELVREQYRTVIQQQRLKGDRIEEVDGNQPLVDVHDQVVQLVKNLLRNSIARNGQQGPQLQQELEFLSETAPLSALEIAAHSDG